MLTCPQQILQVVWHHVFDDFLKQSAYDALSLGAKRAVSHMQLVNHKVDLLLSGLLFHTLLKPVIQLLAPC